MLRRVSLSLKLSAAFFVTIVLSVALVYFLTREPEQVLVPVRGEPLLRIREDGAEVGVRFRP